MARPEQDIWKERIARALAELKKPPPLAPASAVAIRRAHWHADAAQVFPPGQSAVVAQPHCAQSS